MHFCRLKGEVSGGPGAWRGGLGADSIPIYSVHICLVWVELSYTHIDTDIDTHTQMMFSLLQSRNVTIFGNSVAADVTS